jgi:uncharacterized protein
VTGGPVRLRVRLTPRGGRDRIEGWFEAEGERLLRARVAAPPVDGAANGALLSLLAKALRLPKSSLALVAGETSRTKTVEIAVDPAELSARLEALGPGA